jgi:demethylmenaquinone methyltransferase/2-methoxy-6-polyprenyl-1,4-benzoquinol methylase
MANQYTTRKKESYKIFDDIAPTYDFLNRILSLGIDVRWRKKLQQKLPQGKSLEILDMASGTADVPLSLIENKRISHITGIDLSEEMLSIGRKKIEKAGHEQSIQLQTGCGVNIPFEKASFDVITVSFGIRNFKDPQESLNNMHKVLRPGGRALIMEFSIPPNPVFKWIYFFYFRHVLPFVGNILSGHKDAYTYLNQTVEDFPYGDEFLGMMKKAGFKNLKATSLTFGIANIYQGDKC